MSTNDTDRNKFSYNHPYRTSEPLTPICLSFRKSSKRVDLVPKPSELVLIDDSTFTGTAESNIYRTNRNRQLKLPSLTSRRRKKSTGIVYMPNYLRKDYQDNGERILI